MTLRGSSRRCLAGCAEAIGEIKAAALFNAIGAGLSRIIESIHAAELTEPTVELFGSTRSSDALPLTTDLHR